MNNLCKLHINIKVSASARIPIMIKGKGYHSKIKAFHTYNLHGSVSLIIIISN